MGKQTGIEWCHHTFNPWWGCEKVSPGCTNCYAEAWARRTGRDLWRDGERRIFPDRHWLEPLSWNEAARRAGERRRVFCSSMADVFEDRPELDAQRARLFALIAQTRQLDWLLLTKRPENVLGMVPASWLFDGGKLWPTRVWLGTSVEDQARADERVPRLLAIGGPRVRFLSVEPLLGPVDLRSVDLGLGTLLTRDALRSEGIRPASAATRIEWVIIGGESGPRARPCDVVWIHSIVEQCRMTGVPCFVKQLGARPVVEEETHEFISAARGVSRTRDFKRLKLSDPKGGDMEEWPEYLWPLRVREVPT